MGGSPSFCCRASAITRNARRPMFIRWNTDKIQHPQYVPESVYQEQWQICSKDWVNAHHQPQQYLYYCVWMFIWEYCVFFKHSKSQCLSIQNCFLLFISDLTVSVMYYYMYMINGLYIVISKSWLLSYCNCKYFWIIQNKLKIDATGPLSYLSNSTYSLSKPGTYITHNATRPATVWSEIQ